MKATEEYFPVVLFIMLYKVVLTFESVGEIVKCDHSNESYWAVLDVVLFIMLYKVVLTFESSDETLSVTIQMKATEQYFPVVLFIMLYKVVQVKIVLALESVREILWNNEAKTSKH